MSDVRADDPAPPAAPSRREFTSEVPTELVGRRYPFVRIVEAARAERWFTDETRYSEALAAAIECHKHVARLGTDRAYAAVELARREFDANVDLASSG